MSEGELLMRMRAVRSLLQGFQYRYASEVQLHERIGEALTAGGYKFAREVAVTVPPDQRRRRFEVVRPDMWTARQPPIEAKASRFDFLLDPALVIEVKVDGSLGEALRQVARYCRLDEVQGVLIASTSGWARTEPRLNPEAFGGKPVVLAHLQRPSL